MKRRTILKTGLNVMGAGLVTSGLTNVLWPAPGAAQRTCGPQTATNIEGPYYRPSAPETTTLDSAGRLVVSGQVLDASCGPARNAVIEVWHANEAGEYDMQGYQHRGVVRCDESGHYSYRTVRPGHYLNGRMYRPAHIHVKSSRRRTRCAYHAALFCG